MMMKQIDIHSSNMQTIEDYLLARVEALMSYVELLEAQVRASRVEGLECLTK